MRNFLLSCHRKPVPVHPSWCPVQNLTLHTRTQTARENTGISSHSETKGLVQWFLRPVNLAVTSLSGSVRTAARKISSRIQRNWQSPSIQTKKLMDRAQIASLHAQILFQRVNTSLILWNSAFSIHSLSSPIFGRCLSCMVTSPFTYTVWCSRPYKPYIFWKLSIWWWQWPRRRLTKKDTDKDKYKVLPIPIVCYIF